MSRFSETVVLRHGVVSAPKPGAPPGSDTADELGERLRQRQAAMVEQLELYCLENNCVIIDGQAVARADLDKCAGRLRRGQWLRLGESAVALALIFTLGVLCIGLLMLLYG